MNSWKELVDYLNIQAPTWELVRYGKYNIRRDILELAVSSNTPNIVQVWVQHPDDTWKKHTLDSKNYNILHASYAYWLPAQ